MESIKEFPRGITDQAISKPDNLEVVDSVRPGPGQVTQQVVYQVMLTSQSQATSSKLQATSRSKLQAASFKHLVELQAASVECGPNRQAPSMAFRDDRSGDRGSRSSHKVLLVQKRLPGL